MAVMLRGAGNNVNVDSFRRGLYGGLGFAVGLLLFLGLAALTAQSLTSFASGQVVSASALNDNFNTLNTKVSALETALAQIAPTGTIVAFNLTSCPSGWSAADGTGGAPDLRGLFLRGLNDFGSAAGTRADGNQDPDTRALASIQGHSLASHDHQTSRNLGGTWGELGTIGAGQKAYSGGGANNFGGGGNLRTGFAGGSETRPRNIGVIYCIRP